MKPIDYLYFNIYNHFYQRSISSQDYLARMQAVYLFSFSAGGWVLFLEAVYLRIIKHSWFTTKPGATIFAATVYILAAIILNHIFVVNERDRMIYEKYEGRLDNDQTKKRDFLISVFVMAIPYVLLVTLSILFPRHL